MKDSEMRIARYNFKLNILKVLDECDSYEERRAFLAYCRNMVKKMYQKECLKGDNQ